MASLAFYKRWWRRFFRLPGGRGRALWSELHKTGGLWSIWFIAVIGLTGAWYLYEAVQPGPVNYVGPPPGGAVAPPAPSSDPALPPLMLDEVVAKAEAAWPTFQIRGIAAGWYSGTRETVYLEGQAGFPLVRDRANQMHLDPRTGEILWRNGAADLPVYWVWSNMADPLHFGDFGGLWTKSIWFLFGLILSGLILTGTWLHAHRLAREAGGGARAPSLAGNGRRNCCHVGSARSLRSLWVPRGARILRPDRRWRETASHARARRSGGHRRVGRGHTRHHCCLDRVVVAPGPALQKRSPR